MKKLLDSFGKILLVSIAIFTAASCSSDVPPIEAAEKKIVEQFLDEETEVQGKTSEAEDSLLNARKVNLAESANASPHKSKSCDEILVWLEKTVKDYAATGDTIALNSFISIENDVIFNSCLKSENKEFRKKYDKILEILE